MIKFEINNNGETITATWNQLRALAGLEPTTKIPSTYGLLATKQAIAKGLNHDTRTGTNKSARAYYYGAR